MTVIVGNDVRKPLHVYSETDIPDFRKVLTARDGDYAVKESLQQYVVALCLKSQALLLATDEFRTSNDYLTLRQRLLSAYPSVKEGSASSALLLSLYSGSAAHSRHTDRREGDEALSISVFQRIMNEAIRRASDVHIVILDEAKGAVILYRIDGLIVFSERIPQDVATAAVSVAFTKLAEKGTRSDPNFMEGKDQSATIEHRTDAGFFKFRYQSLTVYGGFRVILRILHPTTSKSAEAKPLEALGYEPDQHKALYIAARRNNGMIVVTGPTGSGKTTTLKTLFTCSPTRHRRIQYSVEDPVEYKMFGVGQKSFQRSIDDDDTKPMIAAMRAVLRADPDELMVGEIRDREMSSMAKAFVQSGHPLMTSVHASSAIEIVARLASEELGMPRDFMGGRNSLNALVMQRLVPLLCPHCKIPAHQATEEQFPESVRDPLKFRFNVDPDKMFVTNLDGCEHCHHTGTNGQTVIAEVVIPDFKMRKLFREGHDDEAELYWRSHRKAAFDEQDCTGKTHLEHGIWKATQGLICPVNLEFMTEPFEGYQIYPIEGGV